MTVFLVRHGESTGNLAGVYSGTQDYPLTPRGRDQAAKVGHTLRERHFGAVFTSLLTRAIQTAAIVLAEGHCTTTTLIRSDRLNERNFGILEGTPQIPSPNPEPDHPAVLARTDVVFRPPGGESVRDIFDRVTSYFDDAIVPAAFDGDVLVVAHGNVIRCLTVAWLGWPIKLVTDTPTRNGLITRLEPPADRSALILSRPADAP